LSNARITCTDPDKLRIEVIYALPQRQERLAIELAPGATVGDAIEASGLRQRQPRVDLTRIGIWGRLAGLETTLRDGDRVEIYRPLIADPKVVRRERAARARK